MVFYLAVHLPRVENTVDCAVNTLGAFSACSLTCGSGTYTHTRMVVTIQQGTGTACLPLTKTLAFDIQVYMVDCVISAWNAFSTFSLSCGSGTYIHTRLISVAQQGSGTACDPLTETLPCILKFVQIPLPRKVSHLFLKYYITNFVKLNITI